MDLGKVIRELEVKPEDDPILAPNKEQPAPPISEPVPVVVER